MVPRNSRLRGDVSVMPSMLPHTDLQCKGFRRDSMDCRVHCTLTIGRGRLSFAWSVPKPV